VLDRVEKFDDVHIEFSIYLEELYMLVVDD